MPSIENTRLGTVSEADASLTVPSAQSTTTRQALPVTRHPLERTCYASPLPFHTGEPEPPVFIARSLCQRRPLELTTARSGSRSGENLDKEARVVASGRKAVHA
jgi:hypothetical protein